jgi:hypothetical protein
MGLAPQWETGQCDKACQEKISACMMAFTNGTGNHIDIAMSAHDSVIGTGKPSGWDQEAAFYGNLFWASNDPEKGGAFFCMGEETYDANSGWFQSNFVPRFCQGYPSGACPFEQSFQSCDSLGASKACSESSGAMRNCKDDTNRGWSYAITTYIREIDEY